MSVGDFVNGVLCMCLYIAIYIFYTVYMHVYTVYNNSLSVCGIHVDTR